MSSSDSALTRKFFRPELFKLECTFESHGGLVKMLLLIQWRWAEAVSLHI